MIAERWVMRASMLNEERECEVDEKEEDRGEGTIS